MKLSTNGENQDFITKNMKRLHISNSLTEISYFSLDNDKDDDDIEGVSVGGMDVSDIDDDDDHVPKTSLGPPPQRGPPPQQPVGPPSLRSQPAPGPKPSFQPRYPPRPPAQSQFTPAMVSVHIQNLWCSKTSNFSFEKGIK